MCIGDINSGHHVEKILSAIENICGNFTTYSYKTQQNYLCNLDVKILSILSK